MITRKAASSEGINDGRLQDVDVVGAIDDEGALPPGSIGSVGGVSDRISAKAGKQIARDVTNCRSVKGATA